MILLPGVLPTRTARMSRLSFAWDAKDTDLLARTGQQGTLASLTTATVGNAITPATGAALVSGRGQPRWVRVNSLNALALSQVDSGKDQEQLLYPFAMAQTPLTILLKLTPGWTAGASRATEHFVFGLGNSAVGNDWLKISRGGSSATSWTVTRRISTPVTQTGNGVVEPGTFIWPLDVLVYFDLNGGSGGNTGNTRIQLRDATGATVASTGTGTTVLPTQRWSGEVLGLGSDPATALGAPISLHSAKMALGVYTFAQMDGIA